MIKRTILKLLLNVLQLLRLSLLPFLYTLKPFNTFLKERYDFEIKNRVDTSSMSFKKDGITADYLFEISSEGELEQVMPIINYLLVKKCFIEVVYSSASVEKKMDRLIIASNGQIRRLRLNLVFLEFLRKGLLTWASAKKIILCRYDFYPELFKLGMRQGNEFILVSATLKSKTNEPASFIKRTLYSMFHKIILASPQDKERFSFLDSDKINIETFDFRIMQIAKRKMELSQNLEGLNNGAIQLYKSIKGFKCKTKIIFGSFWENEIAVFQNKDFITSIKVGENLVVLAPHILKKENIKRLCYRLKELGLSIYVVDPKMNNKEINQMLIDMKEKPGVLLSVIPGVLVEFYSLFHYSFIGGGHGRSVHSLLEPYLMNSSVLCGPKTYRSTEYDYVSSYSSEYITIVKELDQFYPILLELPILDNKEELKRDEIIKVSNIHFSKIMKDYFYA